MVKVVIFMAVIFTAITFVAVIGLVASYFEYKGWNGGVCPRCGKPLKRFDVDSQGGEGWTCGGCNYTTWVSYHRMVYHFWNKRKKENLTKK